MTYGWSGDLEERVLDERLNQLGIKSCNYIEGMKQSPTMFQNGRYSIKLLLILGFLCCRHNDAQEKYRDLWALINP